MFLYRSVLGQELGWLGGCTLIGKGTRAPRGSARAAELDERIKQYDRRVREACNEDGRSVKVAGLPGIGPLTATALVAAVNGTIFRSAQIYKSCKNSNACI